jgi:hypothetical protein
MLHAWERTAHSTYLEKTERNKERKIWQNLGVNLRIMILSVSSRVTMGTGSFSGVQLLGHGINHPPPSSAD